LSLEDHCDADTWGVRLLELQRQGFHPKATIADAGKAIRAGQGLAMPGLPCRGDVFHALKTVQSLVTFLENRAYAAEVARQTVRASSLVENLTSRLCNYSFLRRHLGPDYLALLQFLLNHRRFVRSQRPERVGKSPAELLSGTRHPHWLQMLGYVRFSRN
jgi:hypothetical protein